MLGAIIGDMAGTKYEYQEFLDSRKKIKNVEKRRSILNLDIELINTESFYSDDALLTIAVAEAIIYKQDYRETLKKYGRKYGNEQNNNKGFFKNAFSPGFIKWANSEEKENGISNGNGAAMRVSPVAYLFNNLTKVQEEARKATIPSHNSKEAIIGAQSLASTIYLARQKASKEYIKKYITENYGYDLELNLEELQENNTFESRCDITVPQAIYAFLESNNFEDAVRKAISIGGDTDTIACMTGSIAEGYYGIPKDLKNKALNLLPEDLKKIVINSYKVKIRQTIEKEDNFER